MNGKPDNYAAKWDALLNPGSASGFFADHETKLFQPTALSFLAANAWWLAELSRVIYRTGSDEPAGATRIPSRAEILGAAGLREIASITSGGTHCALVCPVDLQQPPYAVLVFRGTQQLDHWLTNVNTMPSAWHGRGLVHTGFAAALDCIWAPLDAQLGRLACPIFFTGHSLGAALATLAAARRAPFALYTFGSPRVGDEVFARELSGTRCYRVVNHADLVASLPPEALGFCHVGELHHLGPRTSQASVPMPEGLSNSMFSRAGFQRMVQAWLKNLEPPEVLADHAPLNYVTRLADQA